MNAFPLIDIRYSYFFFSSRRRHTRFDCDWSSDVCSSDLTMSWLPNTTQGRMVGDYMSSSFDSTGLAHPVFAEAYVPTAGGTDCATATPNCNQPLESPTTGLPAAAGANVANDPVVFSGPSQPGKSAFQH